MSRKLPEGTRCHVCRLPAVRWLGKPLCAACFAVRTRADVKQVGEPGRPGGVAVAGRRATQDAPWA